MKRPFSQSSAASPPHPLESQSSAQHHRRQSLSPPQSPSPPKIQRTAMSSPHNNDGSSSAHAPASALSGTSSPARDPFHLVRTQSPAAHTNMTMTSMSSPILISSTGAGPISAPTSTGVSPAHSPTSSTSPMLDFSDYDMDDITSATSQQHDQDQVVHMDPDSQAAFDSILLIADADSAQEMAAVRAQGIPQPFRVWVAAAIVADRRAMKPVSMPDKEQIKAIVEQAWEVGMKAGVSRDTWMAVAMNVEQEQFATVTASMFCDKAVVMGLGESSSGANTLSAEAEHLIDAGAIFCARTVLHRATLQYPTNVHLWKQYIQFSSENGSPIELKTVMETAGRVCPAALKTDDDDDDDDMYGQSVTISHNPLMSSMDRMRDSDDDNEPHPALHQHESLFAFDNKARSLLHTTPTPDDENNATAATEISPFAKPAAPKAVSARAIPRPSVSKPPLATTTTPNAAPAPTRFSSTSYALPPAQPVTPGLRGLQNLGNTCFMNSALQCMSNTPFLTSDYFNAGRWVHEVNADNPLGMHGAMAKAYAALMKALWSPTSTDRSVAPRHFKAVMAQFAPQFSGYQQHDSSELLGFLLDGLHEDLNRVKNKPYIEAKDAEGRPDDEVADEQWAGHRARNDSIIVDMFQGQYKSRVQCSVCQGVSLTFDPYMVVTLPIPTTPSLVPINVVAVGLGGDKVAKARVWVKKEGSVGELARVVEELVIKDRMGVDAGTVKTKCLVIEWYMRKLQKRFFDLEDVSGISTNDEIWVMQVPAKDGDVPPGLLVEVKPDEEKVEEEQGEPMAGVQVNGVENGQVIVEEQQPVVKPEEEQDADPMDIVPASAPVSRAGSPMAVDGDDSASSKPTAAATAAAVAAHTYVPVIINHQRGKPYSRYSPGNGFGTPTIAYLASPFNPAQAARAVMAAVAPWTTFPLAKYLERFPAVDPTGFVSFEVKDAQYKYSSSALKAGDAVAPAYAEVVCSWDEKVADNVFAEPPFGGPRANTAVMHPRVHGAIGPERAPSTGSTSAASATAAATATATDAPAADGLSDINVDALSDVDETEANKPKSPGQLTASVADSGVASEDSAANGSEATNGQDAEVEELVFEGHHLFTRIEDLGPINPPAASANSYGRTEYSLDQCFDGFVAEEHLGANDPVYCRKCKQHQEASKKVDLWRLPQVLVVSLKRFGSGGGRYRRDKIDAMVDCPHVLDLKDRVHAPGEQGKDHTYELFAISNHFGGLGGGHYTAFAQNPNDRQWYEFDDSRVSPASADQVVSPASYVLFYRKKDKIECEIPEPVTTVSEEDAQNMMSQDPEVGMGWGSGAGGWNSGSSAAGGGGFTTVSSIVPPSGGFSSAYGAASGSSSSSLTLSLRKKPAAADSTDSLAGVAPASASSSASSLLSTLTGFKPIGAAPVAAAPPSSAAAPAQTAPPVSPTNHAPFSGIGHRLDGGAFASALAASPPSASSTRFQIGGALAPSSPGSRAMEMDSDTEDEDPAASGYARIGATDDAMDSAKQEQNDAGVPDRAPQA